MSFSIEVCIRTNGLELGTLNLRMHVAYESSSGTENTLLGKRYPFAVNLFVAFGEWVGHRSPLERDQSVEFKVSRKSVQPVLQCLTMKTRKCVLC